MVETNQTLVELGRNTWELFSCAKDGMGKKLVSERTKTKLAESQFLKRSNCHSVKMN